LRLALALAALGIIATGAVAARYLRRNVVPPDCTDARTLALVRASLTSEFRLPPSVRLEMIQTLAGGYLAFRFVCEASIAGVAASQLPPGPKPGFVHYTSQLTDGGRRHEVSVRVMPLLILEQVQ
jgi:hypothetical protein